MTHKKKIGQTSSFASNADVRDGVACTAGISTKVLDAEILDEGGVSKRIRIIFSVVGKPTWVKCQNAATDNDQKGILVLEGIPWDFKVDGIYSGEISCQPTNANSIVYITIL